MAACVPMLPTFQQLRAGKRDEAGFAPILHTGKLRPEE